MKFHEIRLNVPPGFILCPYPKQFLREFERIKFFKESDEMAESEVTIEYVLSLLSTSEALINWTTSYSGTKGSTDFIVGLRDDYFYISPTGNKGSYSIDVKGAYIRLYAKSPLKQFSGR